MQDVSPWPSSFDVSEPVARVLIDGREVAVESVSVAAELDTALPEMVASGGGSIVAATGTASIAPRADVSNSGLNPWGDAQALVGASEVVVEAGYRDPASGVVGCARQITAQVDALSGGALSQVVGLNFIDYATALDRDITIEPLLQQYPHSADGTLMGAGLSSLYVTNRIVRHCGFYSTPPLLPQAVVSAPLFGSGVPERGTLLAGAGAAGAPRLPVFMGGGVPWGLALGDGMLEYAPDRGSRSNTRLTSTLHVSFMRAAAGSSHTGDSRINLEWGSWQDALHVQAQANGTVIVRYRSGGTGTTVCTLPAADVNESDVFTVLITTAGQATIYASNGATATGTLPLPEQVTATNMSRVIVHVPEGAPRIGGVQVGFTSTRNDNFVRSAHFPSSIYTTIPAFPGQVSKNCLDLLKDQAESELTAMWIDEFGHFQWASRTRLRGSTPRATLTSEHDLLDLQWALPVRSVFSRVDVDHDVPRITRRSHASVTVADSGGSRLSGGDTEHKFFEPPADEDWHAVEAPQWLGGTIDSFELRRGRGSYRGGVIVDDNDDGDADGRMAYSTNLVSTWEQIHPQKWLLTSTAQGLHATEFIEQRFRENPSLYGSFSKESLPLIRARGIVHWEAETIRGDSIGPGPAPVYAHQTGPWIQNLPQLRGLADFLTEELTRPKVILRDVPIVPDPRIQLGDTFWLEDQSSYHVRLRVVVMGKTLTYETTGNGMEMSQRITCRIIEGQRLKTTYQDLETDWVPLPYDALQAAWVGQDYAAFDAAPLDRS